MTCSLDCRINCATEIKISPYLLSKVEKVNIQLQLMIIFTFDEFKSLVLQYSSLLSSIRNKIIKAATRKCLIVDCIVN